MKYCKNCLEPSTRPGAEFNSNGICSTCIYSEYFSENYDENDRVEILKDLIQVNKKNKLNKQYDCIIGVSGGKDSTRQALWVRDKLNLKPLLVCCSYPPEQCTELGAKNLSNLINLGFDLITTSPGPKTWKKFLKQGFYDGNYLRGPELALHSSLPQIAIKYQINLILWGEGGNGKILDKRTIKKKEYDGNSLRNSNTLKNCDLSWMFKFVQDKSKLIPYTYPTIDEFKKNNIQIIYLGWFIKNWSITDNAKYAVLNGLDLRKEKASKTGDLFGAMALDEEWVVINQMIKYLKFGYGRVTDYLNYEIRKKTISRDDAKKIIEKYDGVCDKKYIQNFCNYLEINENEFWRTVSGFVNQDLFTINNKKTGRKYLPKFKVGEGL